MNTNKTTKAHLCAEMLKGMIYGDEPKKEIIEFAKENNLVIVYGASDDLTEFRGAIDDEQGAYEGKKHFLDADHTEVLEEEALGEGAPYIDAIWSPKEMPDTSFLIMSNLPCVHFDIMEDDELYCRGAVVDLNK